MDSVFDKVVDRSCSSSLKWDRYKGRDIIPMWVADMDFEAPPAVIQALHTRVDHGVFGYTLPPAELTNTILEYLADEFSWQIEPGWIVWLPGLVTGINVASRSTGESGNEIITFTPAYPPFLDAPGLSDRKNVTVPLVIQDGRYSFDEQNLKQAITPRTSLLNLCSPHNPTGRVWDKNELEKIAEICLSNDVVICSDEIHNGLVLDDVKHIPTATLSEEVAQKTITLMAPSKTFNIAGLGCSFAIIPNESLRRRFLHVMEGIVPHVNALAYTSALAAYRDSGQWRKDLLEYLRSNRDLVLDFVNERIPELSAENIEATYLAWIDARSLGPDDPARFFAEHGVGLLDGKEFGAEGFVRLNFGCPRRTLMQGLTRMQTAVSRV
ncbi:Cystathionine beta-lyase PatB [Anaerohalosphaera lusitana]|uniref:cysteine-S-conjugate beta-lyase n=1 Tax=Anaerohalosphaera lusitana TaxID=1936003 RepID=A0A1U9NLZ3_9BACT|nr:PatB family C-S lyase [Anaerohalosphaera lusitana]AQT68929.1 Cystathionine beta-lyase PatB [Anaerohalosphaera lusitana]